MTRYILSINILEYNLYEIVVIIGINCVAYILVRINLKDIRVYFYERCDTSVLLLAHLLNFNINSFTYILYNLFIECTLRRVLKKI